MPDSDCRYDAVILTDARYVDPVRGDPYVENILLEDGLLKKALEDRGLRVSRVNWDHPGFDWSSSRYLVFRTTWDYFERYPEFSEWLEKVRTVSRLVNPYEIIRWNRDKHYLGDLQRRGIPIPPTLLVEMGDKRSLKKILARTGWSEAILKPVISGGARHTYWLDSSNAGDHEAVFRNLVASESLMLQEFQPSILREGELAFMVFGGKYSHAILKKAREGDFRVQDDFGGSVHEYKASPAEIDFAERVVSLCNPLPVYARVDLMRGDSNELYVSELELIEPELWFRNHPEAAVRFADAFMAYI